MPTAGDVNVPVNTGVAMGRVSGLLGSWKKDTENYSAEHGWRALFAPDPRYGVSVDEEMVNKYVIEGAALLQRFDNSESECTLRYRQCLG